MYCKYCNSQYIKDIKKIESKYNDYHYTLYQCNDCHSRFFDHAENIANLENLYEEYSVEHNKLVSEKEFVRDIYWEKQVNKIDKISNIEIKSILDVGCRTGDFLLHFSDSIIREGVELSKDSATIAERRGITVYQDFVEDIKFQKKYDVVTCYATLEHLDKPLVFLENLSKIVASNGVLVIMVPTYQCMKRWLLDNFTTKTWHMYNPPEHLNFFSKIYLDRFLGEQNFKLMDRYWSSGGMFNPVKKIPLVGGAFRKIMHFIDEYSIIRRVPIFDHQYSYYLKHE